MKLYINVALFLIAFTTTLFVQLMFSPKCLMDSTVSCYNDDIKDSTKERDLWKVKK